jgi:hypothetical protein
VVGIVVQAVVLLILQEVVRNHGVTVMQVIVAAAVLRQVAAVNAEADLRTKVEVLHTKKDRNRQNILNERVIQK